MDEDQLFQLGLRRVVTACQASFDRELTLDEIMTVIEKVAETFGYPCIDNDRAEDNFSMQFKRGGL